MAIIELIDGPYGRAKLGGVTRTPRLLRVTRAGTAGKLDVLDMLDDEPLPTEELEVFRQTAYGFACSRCACEGGEFASYRHVPLDAAILGLVRDTGAWREWCEQNGPVYDETPAAVGQ